jgi:hypothetical protein
MQIQSGQTVPLKKFKIFNSTVGSVLFPSRNKTVTCCVAGARATFIRFFGQVNKTALDLGERGAVAKVKVTFVMN